jgi:hypothetical protein
MPWTEFVTKPGEEQGRLFADWESGRREKKASIATVAAPATPTAVAAPAASAAATDHPGAALASAGSQEIPTPRPAPAAPSAPPMAAPDLAALYAQLQKTRAELDTKDPVAVARFNEQAAAYQQEKAIAAALSVPKAQPVQARPSTSTALERTRANSPTAKPAKN